MPQPKKKRKYECQRKVEGQKCLGNLELGFDDSIPIFTCEKCGFIDDAWKKFYNEYLNLFRSEDNWKEAKNQVSCIIGLFCSEYEKKYGIKYIFVPKNQSPFNAKECRDAWIMLAAFEKNALEVRKYILWSFKYGIGPKAKITSLAYLNVGGLIREYNLWSLKRNVFRRDSLLPDSLIEWCKNNISEVFKKHSLETMNDLGAILSYSKTYFEKDSIEEMIINKAVELGLIKDGQLNIGK